MHLSFSFLLVSVVVILAAATTDYQCWNFKSTNDLRDSYFNTINNLRRKVVRGNQDVNNGSEKCPKAKEVYQLNWDCSLELEAEALVEKCSESAEAPAGKGLIIHSTPLTTCDPASIFTKTIRSWFSVIEPKTADYCQVYKDESIKDYATMIYAKATKIGCAQKNCNDNLIMACITDQAPTLNGQLYETGVGCTHAKNCTTYEGSKCSNDLCVAGYIDQNKTTTTVETTTSTMPTTTPNPITTTAGPMQDGPNQQCPNNIDMSNDNLRNAFLNKHNELRSQLARGTVFNKMTGTNARPASQMNKLKYNCDAEKTAYNWAKQCVDKQSPVEQRPGLVENRYTFPNLNLDFQTVAIRSSNRWFNEFANVGITQGSGQNRFSYSAGITHFAKMAWDTTTTIGCAIYKCSTFINSVCEYNTPLSEGGQIYKMGPACNRCPSGTTCDNGLCA